MLRSARIFLTHHGSQPGDASSGQTSSCRVSASWPIHYRHRDNVIVRRERMIPILKIGGFLPDKIRALNWMWLDYLSLVMANSYKMSVLLLIELFCLSNLFPLSAGHPISEGRVTIIYGPDGNRDHFQIEGRETLYSADALIVTLKRKVVNRIVLKSQLKLQESDRMNLFTLFKRGDIALKQFWVPISEPPGMIDVLAKPGSQPDDLAGWHDSKRKG
jgi:hypothetical protein